MWRHNLKNWKEVDLQVCIFCLQEAEKRLHDILDESEKITSRSYTLIGILIPVLSVSLGTLLTANKYGSNFTLITLISIFCILIVGSCLYVLSKLVQSRNIWYNGTEPESIFQSEYLENENIPTQKVHKYLLISQLEIIQDKITNNKTVNSERIKIYSRCLYAVIATTLLMLSAILLIAVNH